MSSHALSIFPNPHAQKHQFLSQISSAPTKLAATMPRPRRELADDLLFEVFLRLPADDLACLLRASLTCRRWRRILADPAFRRRHRALHGTPSVLGFFHVVNRDVPYLSRYVPVSPAARGPACRDLPGWLVLDCRHGRALFATPRPSPGKRLTLDFLVWDPLTGEQSHLPRPSPAPEFNKVFTAAVLCAAAAASAEEAYHHRGCHGGAFRVVYLFSRWVRNAGNGTFALVYSSETGDWREMASVINTGVEVDFTPSPCNNVGDKLYFRASMAYAFEYQLGTPHMSIIYRTPPPLNQAKFNFLVSTKDGGLGGAGMDPALCLNLWSREAGPNGVSSCARGRSFELNMILPKRALRAPWFPLPKPQGTAKVVVVGFAEGTDVIFVWRTHAVYMVHLNSGKVTKVFEGRSVVFPYTSFCIPVIDASCTDKGEIQGVSSA